MFTGIIEGNGKVIELKSDQENLHITLESKLTQDLKIDQSLAHNGVCLTVVDIQKNQYVVTAVQETLLKSNLRNLKLGDSINLERAMKMNGRLESCSLLANMGIRLPLKQVIGLNQQSSFLRKLLHWLLTWLSP